MTKQLRLADLPVHESGLRTMDREHARTTLSEHQTFELPECCPVSHNPRPGSMLTLSYRPRTRVLEQYSVRALIGRFKGGFPGAGRYPAERNMEGMIQLVAQMAADALRVTVRARADLVLDAGSMRLTATAHPAPGPGSTKTVQPGTMGERIRVARKAKGMRSWVCARRVQVSRSSLSRYELGLAAPPATTVDRIARVLGVSTQWLITGEVTG